MNLPTSMFERAITARMIAKENPSSIQNGDDGVAWAYDKDSNLWLSFNGNYSATSPEEKMRKQLEWEKKNEEQAQEKYLELLYWSKVRQMVLMRDNHTCQLCGAMATTKLHIHHIMKRSKEGTDHLDNLITLCPKCHAKADHGLYNPEWIKP